jgi:hypothetical protein
MSEQLIGACGLTCSECDAYLATQAGDTTAVERIAAAWAAQFQAPISATHVWCDGCMTGGERHCAHCAECEVRACVRKNGLTTCAACPDYGCSTLEAFLTFAAESGARETLEALRG